MTIFPSWLTFLGILSQSRGRYLGRFVTGMGCGARGRGGRALRTRGALGNRPCPLRGAAFNGWTRQAKGGETCLDGEKSSRPRSEVRSQGRRSRRGGTLRGVAVCL